ncbi:MAG TPA: VOC family protein [Candidatus Thermoplasmatota archaeon]|jgi:predicted enzyme related to lactoylglutathione lyase|nr:VOC family protein [Candidatus Thermoplasmatota archaeon]
MAPPFGALRFLYVGSAKFAQDLRYYTDVLGAPKVWHARAFGAEVAAVRMSEQGPLLLLADHRPAGTCMPVYEVPDLGKAVRALRERGWKEHAGPFGIPNGDCYTFRDPSGNELAMFEDERPLAMQGADAAGGGAEDER